ncbi:MAG: sigma-70 family RNA polymerase sigma factor [Solirubrobacteraceae bacterium]
MTGRQSDFTRVYDDHVWRVYGFIAHRLRDRDVAEDLTQATFERALRAWSRFDPRRASEQTWLLAIARNLMIDYYRRDRSAMFEPIDERLEPSVAGPEEALTSSPELIDALAQLSERDREILALRFGGDLSGPEIATLMGLSLANVQQILSRSLRKLRGLLERRALAPQVGIGQSVAGDAHPYSAPTPTSVPSASNSPPPPMQEAAISRSRAGRGP